MRLPFTKLAKQVGLTLVATVFIAAAALAQGQELTGTIMIDGSSTVFPITEAVAEEFQFENPDVRIPVGVSGSGGGFKKFCSGETVISDASRPIKQIEIDMCAQNGVEFVELPVAYDGLSVMVNPTNTWVDFLTVEELKKIWEPEAQGLVTHWDQVRDGWPHKEIHLYGPGVDSGTFDYFTETIVGASGASRGDFVASEDDNVLVQGIMGDPLALGYFGYAYYAENQGRLKLVPIVNPKTGEPVAPSEETISSNRYFLLSRPLFIYVSKAAADRPEVEAFIEYYLTEGAWLAADVGYVALPERIYDLVLERFEARKTGSVFADGVKPGVSLEELLKQ